MITGVDVKSGYGQKKEKPYNSILPYLRSKVKDTEKVEADKKLASSKEEIIREAIHSIVMEE